VGVAGEFCSAIVRIDFFAANPASNVLESFDLDDPSGPTKKLVVCDEGQMHGIVKEAAIFHWSTAGSARAIGDFA